MLLNLNIFTSKTIDQIIEIKNFNLQKNYCHSCNTML